MKIKITKINSKYGNYMADMINLGGSPGIGYGNTPEEAVAELFQHQIVSISPGSPSWRSYAEWIQCIDPSKLEVIREGF